MLASTGRSLVDARLGYGQTVTEPRVHQEVERKMEVPARFRLPALSGAGGGIGQVKPQPTQRLTADYYDTADLRLARNRITMRRRTGGGDDGWHLKLPHADEATRDEVQLPLATAGAPPQALAHLVLGITRNDPLQPVATLRTERRPSLIDDEHGVALAELTDDRVSVTIGGKVVARFRELEVEAANGRTARDLEPVVAALLAAGATESSFDSKLVRALGARAIKPPDVPTPRKSRPHDTAGDAIQNLFARQITAFLKHDLRLRRNLPDSVHQLRVAARRLRSSLKVFAPLLDAEWAAALREELAWIAGVLGDARDNEVLENRLLAGLSQINEQGTGRAATVVKREMGRDEQKISLNVTAAMLSARYTALLDSLVEAAATPRLSPASSATAEEALPPLMRATWRRLARSVRALRKNGPDEAWHATRIRAKQARYAADALVPIFGRPAKELAAQLEVVTELLGRHQDAAVAADAAAALATAQGVGGPGGFALGLLHNAQRAEMRAVRKEFERTWPTVAKPRRRRWLSNNT